MSETRITLQDAGAEREFILIGTAHISKESIDEVKRVIQEEKPGMVCVEIDAGRYKSMTEREHWENLNVASILKEGKGFLLIANLVLAGFQRRMGSGTGVQPGEEMRVAIETAQSEGIAFSLCDREIHTTLRRAWSNCNLWNKCKLLSSLLMSAFSNEKLSEKELEELKNRSELDGMMDELASYLPPVKKTLIDERDCYLAAKIWENRAPAEAIPLAEGGTDQANHKIYKKTVVIIGAGHLKGTAQCLEDIAAGRANVDVSDLETITKPGLVSKALPWVLPALIVLLIVAGFFRLGGDASLSMLLRWLLLNGSLSALGALIALGHPLSILISFFGAPIGTISPFLSVGLFSGLVEVSVRKPRVQDAENLMEDISSLKGIYRNRIIHALLIFLLSSLGGAIGNVISIPSLAGQLIG